MLVLVVEIMGASTVVLYGINLLFLPDAPVYHPDPARPGLPKVWVSSILTLFLLESPNTLEPLPYHHYRVVHGLVDATAP